MAGLLELFARWVVETGERPSDAVARAAGRVRSSGDPDGVERAADMERINRVLFGREDGG